MKTSPNSSETQERSPRTAAELLELKWPALRAYCPILNTVSAPQTAFLVLDCTEALYGGAVGGGKTGALLMAACQYVDIPGYAALILRRTFPELEQPDGPIEQSLRWFSQTPESIRPVYNQSDHEWKFPSGTVIRFGHLDHPNAMIRYQGGGYHFFGFDELTHFDEKPYEFIGLSRTRRPADGPLSKVPMRIRSTANPGGPGHDWVYERFIDDETRKVDRVFIPAKLSDNPGIDQADYITRLEKLDETLRQQLLDGDWDCREDLAYTITDDHLIPSFALDDSIERFEALDHGFNGTPWCLWAVDYEGNLIAVDMIYERDKLPSDIAPEILERRKAGWGFTNTAWADPSLWHRTGTKNRWGDPAKLADEFRDNGVPIVKANEDPRAGMTRIRELLKCDHGNPALDISPHLFPPWHQRAGEPGGPRMFFTPQVADLVKELKRAPLQPLNKPDGREKVDPEWESKNGHAAAMCRYAVMTRPAPSVPPPKTLREQLLEPTPDVDLRREALRKHLERVEKPRRVRLTS